MEGGSNSVSHRDPTPTRALAIAILCAFLTTVNPAVAQQPASRILLKSGWTLQSSCHVQAAGLQISVPGSSTVDWHKATVPTTVLAALVADGTFPDPYVSDNLRNLPGAAYDTNQNFLLQPMPADSPFACPWWYRTEFVVPGAQKDRFTTLHFDGINNHANIWLNGKKIADASQISSADRTYEFDISKLIRPGEPNALAVEVSAPNPTDFAINWIDWNPAPPDKNMGLWRDVYINTSGPVEIQSPQVVTHFPFAALDPADLTVEATVQNMTRREVRGDLDGEIENIRFRQKISLKRGEWKNIRFAPAQFPQLRMKNPRVWWPAQMGEPALYNLRLRFVANSEVSDEKSIRFGIREITSQIDDHGSRLFRINGKSIFIRGAGWAPDMLLRESPERLRSEFDYVRDLNLNTLRLEGKLETDDFYDLADERGVLIMAGFSCCDRWQDGEKWSAAELQVAAATLHSQSLRLRSHPSVLAWLNGSDQGPPANVEQVFLDTLKATDWPNPILFSAAEEPSALTGPTGVKMTGPYDYVPPDFWLADDGHNGGAAGFNVETSPGPAIPQKGSLEKMVGAAHVQMNDPLWSFHAAQGTFSKFDDFNEAMSAIYGAPTGLDDYERKAQAMSYDSERAMFEAYTRNKYEGTTGIIQWMLNNAWPSLSWHLYDYYLQPAGGYFGAKKALEPLHVQYSYDDRSVVVVNSTYAPAANLKVEAILYDAGLHEIFSKSESADVAADAVAKMLTIPESVPGDSSPLRFLRLALTTPDGQIASTNFYWLPAQPNVFDWSKASFRYTPVSHYEDLTALNKLPNVTLTAAAEAQTGPKNAEISVQVANPSNALAFQVRLAICPHEQEDEAEILPLMWSDNYIALLPGETRNLTVTLAATASGRPLDLVVTGWNISPLRIAVRGN